MSSVEHVYLHGRRVGSVQPREFTSKLTGKTKTVWDHQIPPHGFVGGHATRTDAVDVVLRAATEAAAS